MPERTCIACRKTADKPALIRFVVERCGEEWQAVLDVTGCRAGRGFYCHPAVACLLSKKFEAQVERAARSSKPFRNAGVKPRLRLRVEQVEDAEKNQRPLTLELIARAISSEASSEAGSKRTGGDRDLLRLQSELEKSLGQAVARRRQHPIRL